MGKFTHQLQTESLKLVLFYEFVEVDGEQFEGDAHVIAEDETVVQMDDVHFVVFILFLEVFEDLDLLLGLPMEPWLVANHLQCYVHVILVVVGFDYLTETALTDHF